MARVLVDSEVEEIVELCKRTIRREGRYTLNQMRRTEIAIEDAAERAQRILDIIEGRY